VTNNFTLKLKIPKTEAEWKVIANGINDQWNLGAVDGKHVSIKTPPHTGSYYYNYKKIFSVVLMAVVNLHYEFIMANADINGRISDGGFLGNTTFGNAIVDKLLKIPEPCILSRTKIHRPEIF
jgi:hypothetical protein